MVEQKNASEEKPIRPIDQRYLHPVAGIDLAESLNYIELDVVGESFIYDHYTGSRLPYKQGSRPQIEEIAQRVTAGIDGDLQKVMALAEYVIKEIPWAGYYEKDTGEKLPSDRAFTEEQLIDSGYGWCNEQARIMCVLTQAIGYPSRLVLMLHHTLMEVLLPDGWMAVDSSFGYCFVMDGKPVRAADVYRNERCRKYFEPIYKQLCEDIGKELDHSDPHDFAASFSVSPVGGFENIGYHNHFLL